jgi:hypothetical protein
MSQPHETAADVARRFLARLTSHSACRIEARVASPDGMPVLCAVEQALADRPRGHALHELVWLAAASAGAPHLRLQAFGPGGELVAEAVHDLGA